MIQEVKKYVLNDDVISLQKGFLLSRDEYVATPVNLAWASTIQSNLMVYGYMLDKDAFQYLSSASVETALEINNNLMDYLRYSTGGKLDYKSLYPDFPNTVMDQDDITEFYYNCLGYYWQNGEWPDQIPVMSKPIKFERIKYKMLKLGNYGDLLNVFTSLVSVNQSLMPQDIEIIEYFVKNHKDELIYPSTIPFKENLCRLAAMQCPGIPVKTSTDVLRIAVYMSGGDPSLPAVPSATISKRVGYGSSYRSSQSNPEREKFKFRTFKRSERRYLLGLLNDVADPKEMVLKDQRWVRLGEKLHPGEYKNRFPRAYQAFQDIRNTKVKSWYSSLKEKFEESLESGLNWLSQRPGEYTRRLDSLLRNNPGDTKVILHKFTECSTGVSNKVLYETYQHFEGRSKPVTGRSIMIKGARKRTKLPDLPALDNSVILQVQDSEYNTLYKKFEKLEPLGKVYIDPELKKIPVPTNMRSVNFSLAPAVRGQRIPWPVQDTPVIRAFYHWTDKNGSLDPDLSCTFVKEDGRSEVLSYHHLSIGKSVHSGDIIARLGNNAEYIDIHVQDALDRGYRYVTVDVRNFRGGSLREMDGMFGLMHRDHPEANNTWTPDTTCMTVATSSEAGNTLLAVLDLETKEYIFLDIDTYGPTVAALDKTNIMEMLKFYTQDPKFSVWDLLILHAAARGEITDSEEDADTMFKFEDFSKDYVKTCAYMGI